MSIPVIDSEEYQERLTGDFSGMEEMFKEYGNIFVVEWDDQANVKSAKWSINGELLGYDSYVVDRAVAEALR